MTTKSALDAAGARTAVNGNALTGYLGFDLHGNTALAENGSKTITDALRYDAWGELIASTTSALPTPWRTQGRLDVGPDASNPLYDFGARAYRPVTGAFTSLDSYAGQAIDPLSMNRFLYAEANPATFVDPDGHSVDSGIGNCIPSCPADVKAAAAAKQAAANAAKASKAADDRESAHIIMRAGGAAAPAGPSSPASSECRGNRGCLGALRTGGGSDVARSFATGVAAGALVTGLLLATCAVATAGICLAAGFGVGLVGAIGIQSDINTHGAGIEGTPAHIGGHEPWSAEEVAFLAGGFIGSYGAEAAAGMALAPAGIKGQMPHFPAEGEIDPNLVRFSQTDASYRMQRGTVQDLADDLAAGRVDPNDLRVDVVVSGSRLVSNDNRRLAAFQIAGVPIPYRVVSELSTQRTVPQGGTTLQLRAWGSMGWPN